METPKTPIQDEEIIQSDELLESGITNLNFLSEPAETSNAVKAVLKFMSENTSKKSEYSLAEIGNLGFEDLNSALEKLKKLELGVLFKIEEWREKGFEIEVFSKGEVIIEEVMEVPILVSNTEEIEIALLDKIKSIEEIEFKIETELESASYSINKFEKFNNKELKDNEVRKELRNLKRVKLLMELSIKKFEKTYTGADKFWEKLNEIMKTPIIFSEKGGMIFQILLIIEKIEALAVELKVRKEEVDGVDNEIEEYWLGEKLPKNLSTSNKRERDRRKRKRAEEMKDKKKKRGRINER